jgi:hypothetical protein
MVASTGLATSSAAEAALLAPPSSRRRFSFVLQNINGTQKGE